jgi:hypothetical protein
MSMRSIFRKVSGESWFEVCRPHGHGVVTRVMVFFFGLLLVGCASMPQWGPDDREKLVKASNDYNNMLRWKDPDNACVTFAEASAKAKCLESALTLKEVTITDIRTRDIDFKIDGVDATVHAEIEYYLLPSTTVRKIQDTQKWGYIGPQDKKIWVIKSPFPNFTTP